MEPSPKSLTMKSLLLTLSILLSATALVVALVPSRSMARDSQDPELDARLGALSERIAALEALEQGAEPAVLAAPPATQVGPMTSKREALAGEDLRAFQERLDSLEQWVRGYETERERLDERSREGIVKRFEQMNQEQVAQALERKIEVLADQALNRDLSEHERLQALGWMRDVASKVEADPRLEVLDEMIYLGNASAEASVRADVWRQLDGVVDDRLLPALLAALRSDPDRRAREEAAETLAEYLPNEAAREGLRQAAEVDPDERVRSQALRSLSGGGK